MSNLSDYENITALDSQKNLRFKITEIHKSPNHWHESLELLYYFNKNGKVTCDDVVFEAKKGDLIVINSAQYHFTEGNGMFLFHIDFPKFCDSDSHKNIMFRNHIKNDETIKEIYTHIIREYEEQSEGFDIAIRGYAYILMTYLMRNYRQDISESDIFSNTRNKTQLIGIITEYIAKNYFMPLKTALLAETFHISKQYLCTLFKSYTGQSVTSYINEYRIKKAAILLKNTNQNITEIANSVGYDDSNYFSRIFKHYTGMTPKEYKNDISDPSSK